MPRHVVLLRGINIGPRNRIAMPALREALEEAGFTDVQTYLQSGNVVLESRAKPETVQRKVEKLIEERFGLEIAVVVRTRAQLAAVVKRNPHAKVATEPKRYQVTFLEQKLPAKVVRELEEVGRARRARGRRRPRGLRLAPEDDRPLEALVEARRQERSA